MFWFHRYLYTRWIDGGSMEGFVKANQHLLEGVAPKFEECIMWQVATAADITKMTEKYNQHLHAKRQKLPENSK